MTDESDPTKPERPLLPRDAFRAQRLGKEPEQSATKPVVVTPAYDDVVVPVTAAPSPPAPSMSPKSQPGPARAKSPAPARSEDGPFAAYGQRSASRPYALRLPDAIDLALRQIAAEERTHPLRIIDRILYEHLHAIGKLPSIEGS